MISRRSIDAAKLAEAQAAFDRRLIDFCDRLSAGDLDRRVITDRREDGKIPERIGDLLAHLFIHQIHHRGQVHAMLSGTSVKPPQLDEFFLDYDQKLRSDEVERLGLGERCSSHPQGSKPSTRFPPLPSPNAARLLRRLHLEHAAADLVFLDRFEQRPEIALAKSFVALALDEFEEDRADHGF